MRYSIALDIDDVLAQFYPAMCRRFNMSCNRINIWDGEGEAFFVANNFHIIENNKRFWLNLEKQSRVEDINFRVDYYLTSSPQLMLTHRKAWLDANGFPPAPILISNNKAQTMRQQGIDVLIDDKPSTLELVKASGMIPIQYVPSYMSDERPHLNIIRHLSEVPNILNNI